jgi:hypothetical protein
MLGEGSDRQIDIKLAEECKDFKGSDPIRFLRDLRDKCVRYGASSGFVIRAISTILSTVPEETEEQKEERRMAIELKEQSRLDDLEVHNIMTS